jgi:nucleoid-associated protein YgaU
VCRAVIFCAIVCVSFCAIQARGQDAAEAARQEKARKAAGQNSSRHVYTEEDLKRKTILTPEDQARVEARNRQQGTAPAEQNAQRQPNDNNPRSESLGEIARRFRQEKAAREAELAAKKKFSPFPYQAPESSLAEPKPEVGPPITPGFAPGVENRNVTRNHRFVPQFYAPATSPHARISPFQPRPLAPSPSIPPSGITAAPVQPSDGVRSMEKTVSPELVRAGTERIEVQPGQSWWKLAAVYLGDGARWPELRKLNAAGGPPELLKSGSSVVVPVAANRPRVSTPVIEVRQGDSLWSLAKEHFGRGALWVCLAAANPHIGDYTHLAVGTLLSVPEGDALNTCKSLIQSRK